MKLANYNFPSDVTGVFIDDTGSPGQVTESKHLHPNRKTWVAVLLPPKQFQDVVDQMPGTIEEMKERFDVREFHFADILGGRKEYKGIDLSVRLGIFEFMSFIFASYHFPIVCQTFNPAHMKDYRKLSTLKNAIPGFDLSNHTHAALWFLIINIKKYLKSRQYGLTEKAVVFIDEGLKRAGHIHELPYFSKDFIDGKFHFDSSEKIFPIQLADYAAFCLNKTQMIMSKDQKTTLDITLMKIFEIANFNFLNIPKVKVDITKFKSADFDDFHKKDRISKGLKPDLPEV